MAASRSAAQIDAHYRPAGTAEGPGGVVVYWAVDDVQAAFDRLLASGATEHEKPMARGEAYITATVIDPFGNILGIMQNPTTTRCWPGAAPHSGPSAYAPGHA